MELTPKISCDGFPTDSDTSSKSGVDFPCGDKKEKVELPPILEQEPSCSNVISTSSSSSSTLVSGYFNSECRVGKMDRKEPPNIGYELAIAKTIMQQYSTLSGDNLFDHLSDIIKRVIDERPPNVIDFFEEFSRSVREQKFHMPERFPPDAIFEENRMYRVAKKLLLSMKLPIPVEDDFGGGDGGEENAVEEQKSIFDLKLDLHEPERLFITFNERVQQMQFYWNQCGFSISSDDIFQLACAMNRLQTHPSILQVRFWGVINGLKASYYIVEASLTREELNARLEQMENELIERQEKAPRNVQDKIPISSIIGPELQPGALGWESWPIEDVEKMKPDAEPVPLVEVVEVFNVPPESIGLGANRYSYFVVNAFSDDWIELPIVTPNQIIVSRKMKKFLTGDLEAEIVSYPCFPGKEKHYLRSLIARITAGTYIAPSGYYRKMTKRERRIFEGMEDMEMEEEEEEEPVMMGEGEEEEEEVDNDIVLLRNEKYEPKPLNTLSPPANWIHTRPNILNQGRVVWFDEEKARKEREKEMARYLRQQMMDEMEEEEEEAEPEAEGEEEDLLDGFNPPEIGPPIMNPCHFDMSDEFTVPWIARFTSRFTNKNERVIIMQSNVWPGAYTFTFDKICESIYMGWGHKYTSRNMDYEHLRPVFDEYPHGYDDFAEAIDPSVADEEAYRLSLLKKEKPFIDVGEHLSDFDEGELTHESTSGNEEEE